jgi:16S rRNA G1207 methylase RsmC
MVDKDFVAVEYANANAARNHIDNAEAILSDGLRHVPPQRFSLAVTNLPAKTSKEHYYLFFNDIHARLESGGRFYVVVISGLRQFVARAFDEVFGNHKKLKQGRQYTVAMAQRRPYGRAKDNRDHGRYDGDRRQNHNESPWRPES